MRKDHWLLRSVALLALSAVLMTGVSLAAEAGSTQDPLVTLSYLNDTFFNQIMQRVDQKIAERTGQALQPGVSAGENDIFVPSGGTIVVGVDGNADGSSSVSSSSASFVVVTLSEGQALTGNTGCEVMLRIGSAVCVSPSDPGLIDETTAGTLSNGASLAQNHLYMMTIEGRSVRATAATTKLLVRGSYTVA